METFNVDCDPPVITPAVAMQETSKLAVELMTVLSALVGRVDELMMDAAAELYNVHKALIRYTGKTNKDAGNNVDVVIDALAAAVHGTAEGANAYVREVEQAVAYGGPVPQVVADVTGFSQATNPISYADSPTKDLQDIIPITPQNGTAPTQVPLQPGLVSCDMSGVVARLDTMNKLLAIIASCICPRKVDKPVPGEVKPPAATYPIPGLPNSEDVLGAPSVDQIQAILDGLSGPRGGSDVIPLGLGIKSIEDGATGLQQQAFAPTATEDSGDVEIEEGDW